MLSQRLLTSAHFIMYLVSPVVSIRIEELAPFHHCCEGEELGSSPGRQRVAMGIEAEEVEEVEERT